MTTIDPVALEQARRVMRLARTNEHIQQAVASAPPLDAATLALIQAAIPPLPLSAVSDTPKPQPGKGIRPDAAPAEDAEGGAPDAA